MNKMVLGVSRLIARGLFIGGLTCWLANAAENGVVRGEPVAPVSVVTNAAGHAVFDFGRHFFGWVEVYVQEPGEYDFVWGELLDSNGSVQTNEFYTKRQGAIRCACTKGTFAETGWTRIPYESGGCSSFNAGDVGDFGRVMPFRWLEVAKAPFGVKAVHARQIPVYYPYDVSESSFECDDEALNRIYAFCKHSVRATTFMGLFIDGDRERLPYEADSFITQLSTYAVTSDDTLVRRTIEHLSANTTWPTEWKQFFIRMVYEDWMHSGRTDLVRRYWPLMKDLKSWRSMRRADGLVVSPGETRTPSPDGGKFYCDIADWAKCYRDGFVFTPVNVIVNALHYHNLCELEAMARAIGEKDDADEFAVEASRTKEAFRRVFYDSDAGRCRDGEGTDHATVQGNAMALACGVLPEDCVGRVAEYVAGKGFSCSTYMAQFVLEALFLSGRDEDAFRLMTGAGERGWIAKMEKGATITTEFWDLTLEEPRRVPDMNHAWSTAPLNMIGRFVLGVTPLKPGFETVSIRPHSGPLRRFSGSAPTPRGSVHLEMEREGDVWRVAVETPCAAELAFMGRTASLSPGKRVLTVRVLSASCADCGAEAGLSLERTASVYHSYEFEEVADTPPPDGFKPFYISHYGRHGSRRLTGTFISDTIKALEANRLTPQGEELLDAVRCLARVHDGMIGELSLRGAGEHRTLARRMSARFPDVFKVGGKVRCQSSNIPRVLMSMVNFCTALKEAAPLADFEYVTGDRYFSLLRPEPRDRDKWDGLLKSAVRCKAEREIDMDAMLSRFFVPPVNVEDRVIFIYNLFVCASDFQCMRQELGEMDIYHLFKPGELAAMSRCLEAYLYGDMANSEEFGGYIIPPTQVLWRDFVDRADSAIAGGHVSADLRFGHDSGLWPLAGLIGIEGPGDRVPIAEAADKCPGWKWMPMAANLQMVFYRDKSGEVLVKVLYNEQEMHIKGLSPIEWPYYRWQDVRDVLTSEVLMPKAKGVKRDQEE